MYGCESSIFTLLSKLKSNGCITKLLFCYVVNAYSVESSIFVRLVCSGARFFFPYPDLRLDSTFLLIYR
jgi:hypothetical protein